MANKLMAHSNGSDKKISLNPMLNELNRWRRTRRPTAITPRWSGWAQAIIERYAKMLARRDSLSLAFLRPLMFTELLQQRVTVASPQFNLRVHVTGNALSGATANQPRASRAVMA